jgi:hypothetical protein
MKHPLLPLFVLVAAAIPAVAPAAVIAVSPPNVNLQIGGLTFAKIMASTASKHLEIGTSTCFTQSGSPRDILKVTELARGQNGNFNTLTIQVKALRAGKCEIKFRSDAHSQAVNVNVKPEEP